MYLPVAIDSSRPSFWLSVFKQRLCRRTHKAMYQRLENAAGENTVHRMSFLSVLSVVFIFVLFSFFFLLPDGQLRSSWHLSLLRAVVVVVVVIPGGVRLSFSLLVYTHMFYKSHLFSSVRHAGRKKKKDSRNIFSLIGTFFSSTPPHVFVCWCSSSFGKEYGEEDGLNQLTTGH